MNSDPFATRVAVIGIGAMGRNHARVFHELPEAELIAIADCDHVLVQSASHQFGIPGYSDYREMLDKEKPEAVSIAVPTAQHLPIALAALEAGAHILIEKPIAASIEDGLCMIEKANRLKRQLMVGHIVRFNPAVKALKEKLEAGEAGRIFQIVCRRVGPFPTRVQDVGVVIDLATHDIDLIRYITGQEPVRVYAETGRRIHTEHEDLLFGLLRFPDGLTGSLEINWLTPTKVREVLVLGEHGLFRVDDLTQDLYFYENASVGGNLWPPLQTLRGVSEGKMVRYALQRYEPLKAELQAFLQAIRNQRPMPVNGSDGLDALWIALALMQSGQTHQVVEMDHAGWDELR